MDKVRILVIEDEAIVAMDIAKTLKNMGHDVTDTVPSGQGNERYGTIPMASRETFSANVIFTTGGVMGGEIMSFIEYTARPLLPKPFTPGELKAVVQEALK